MLKQFFSLFKRKAKPIRIKIYYDQKIVFDVDSIQLSKILQYNGGDYILCHENTVITFTVDY